MRIVIVGAGIVGITTAYELARDGHEVVVLEQRSAVAEEASFANAGLLAPGLLRPWAAPGVFGPARWPLLGPKALVRIASGASRADLQWLWRWRQTAQHNARSLAQGALPPALAALEELARYSQARLRQTLEALQLDPEIQRGGLVLLRTEQEHAALAPLAQLLRDAGLPLDWLDADAARRLEPGLSPHTPLAGALHLPEAEAGNCRLLALMLRQAAQELGVRFIFNAQVARLHHAPTGVQLAGETAARHCDAVVLCAGMASAALLRPLGLRLPLTALHGYTLSASLREELHAPQGSVMDAARQISIARLGLRIRVGGGAELGGGSEERHEPTLARLYATLTDWFPGGAQLADNVQVWRGIRAMPPDGLPVLGASGLTGLWLNLGHGDSGWALASGGARLLADLIAQREPETAHEAFALQRF
ncbi:MAG: FAD-dependent oxidoreductase [Acidovorax sp.]